MYNNSLVKVKELYSDIASTFNIETEQTNKLATETYNLLTNVTQGVTTLKNKISVLGDMLTDLRVLNGSAKNIIPLTNLKVIENKGIKIKDSKFELDYITNELKEIDASLSSLTSVSTYKLYTIDGKESYLNDLIKTKTEIEVKFPNKNFTFDLNLRYQTQEQINTIVLQLGLLTEAYPDILSIKYVDHENNLKDIIILDTNTRNYSLNDNRVKDNLYIFNITPVVTDQIIIQLASRESDSVLLKGIETYYSNILSNGYIILGPISTEDPILKLAVDSSTITEGIKIEVSTDKNYWIELNNSSSIGLNGTKKILSINTIGSNSIKNDQDIYSMYVKISIQSSVLSNENLDVSVYNTLREDSTIGNDLLNTIENIRLSAYRVSSSDYSYGNYIYNNTTNLATLPLDRIEYIQNNGIFKVLGLVDTKYSITDTNNTSNVLGSIGAELKLKRMVASSTLDADTYDVANCKLYDIYPRKINEIVNTRQKDNLCLMLKQTNKNIEVPVPLDSCEGATNSVHCILAVDEYGLENSEDLSASLQLIVDGVPHTFREVVIGLNIEPIDSLEVPFLVEDGFEFVDSIKLSNGTSVPKRIEIITNTEHIKVYMWDNPTINQIDGNNRNHVGACLSANRESETEVTCDGATNTSGCIDIGGLWDLEIDGVRILTDVTPQQIESYLINESPHITNHPSCCPEGYYRSVFLPYPIQAGSTIYIPIALTPDGESITTPMVAQGPDPYNNIGEQLAIQLEPHGLYAHNNMFSIANNTSFGITYYDATAYNNTFFYILDEGNTFSEEDMPRGLPPYRCFFAT